MTEDEKLARIRWLKRYRASARMLNELRAELKELESRAERTTPVLTGLPAGTPDNDKIAAALEAMERTRARLCDEIAKMSEIEQQIVEAVNGVPDFKQREVLRKRYIRGMRWEDIAVEMSMEYSWVHRLHVRALAKIHINKQ